MRFMVQGPKLFRSFGTWAERATIKTLSIDLMRAVAPLGHLQTGRAVRLANVRRRHCFGCGCLCPGRGDSRGPWLRRDRNPTPRTAISLISSSGPRRINAPMPTGVISGTRTRFACEVVKACRQRAGAGLADYSSVFHSGNYKTMPRGWRARRRNSSCFLGPLVDAGVDIFDCSTRRFWIPEFDGSDLGLAGWTKNISGKPTMAVGSVGLDGDVVQSVIEGHGARTASLERLQVMLDRGEFDLVGVGRALLADSRWPAKVRNGSSEELKAFRPEHLLRLT